MVTEVIGPCVLPRLAAPPFVASGWLRGVRLAQGQKGEHTLAPMNEQQVSRPVQSLSA